MLKFESYKERLVEDNYIQIYKEVLEMNDVKLTLITLQILSMLSENLELQYHFIETGFLSLVYEMLNSNKDEIIMRQSTKFLSNLSQNLRYTNLLINQGFIDIMIVSANSDDKEQKINGVIFLSNLSKAINFHSMIDNL